MSDGNGYKNRSTWNVCLWLGNDEPLYRQAQQFRKRHGKVTASAAKEFCLAMFGEETPDGCELRNVNWKEVAECINEF